MPVRRQVAKVLDERLAAAGGQHELDVIEEPKALDEAAAEGFVVFNECNGGGSSWSAANATANKISAMGQTIITVSGTKTSGENMVITLNNISTVGDYNIGGGGKAGASFSPAGEVGPGSYSAQSGSLKLTRLDDSGAEGTFSFNGKLPDGNKSTSVTDGKFKVSFDAALGG